MSFKIKDKTIFITIRGIIVLILTVTLCILVLWERGDNYTKLFESVCLLALGFLFGKGEIDSDNK